MAPPMKSARKFEDIPRTWSSWNTIANRLNGEKTINTHESFNSASKIKPHEYILFRSIWPKPSMLIQRALENLGLLGHFEEANKWLGAYPPFQMYLNNISLNIGIKKWDQEIEDADPLGLGIFKIPHFEQKRIADAFLGKNFGLKKSPIVDEDSVNSAFLSLLCAITIKHSGAKCIWTPHRTAMQAEFRKGTLEAQIDGYLPASKSASPRIRIIVEVKAKRRGAYGTQVSMQETAELVAWLKTQSPEPGRIYIISQYGPELSVKSAEFTGKYLQYLEGSRSMLPKTDFFKYPRVYALGYWNF